MLAVTGSSCALDACADQSFVGHSPVREELAELVGGIDESIELRRRLPIRKHVGGEVVDVHLRERRARRFDARVWALTAPATVGTVALAHANGRLSRLNRRTSYDSVGAQRI